MSVVRDDQARRRLATMRERRMLNEYRKREASALAALRNGADCQCLACVLKRGALTAALAKAQADADPGDVAAIAPNKAH